MGSSYKKKKRSVLFFKTVRLMRARERLRNCSILNKTEDT